MQARALAFVALTTASASVHALAGEVGGHWAVDTYTLEVVPPEGNIVDTDTLMRAAEAAAESWNHTNLGPQIVVLPAGEGVAGGFAFDHHNTLSFVTSWDYDRQYAGLTRRALQGDTIIEADSLINAADWQFCDGSEHQKIDLQSVLTHELGHTLGLLDDKSDDAATMFYGSRDEDVSKRSLAPQ
ncbi:MAG TPA: matrixin family metalloprotease, partial [Myxococcota bacterium]